MEFRWVAIIALWTMLTGPIFTAPSGSSSRAARTQAAVKTVESTRTVPPGTQR
jgi:hypothetical protein